MKKYIPIYLYGVVIILDGIFLLFPKDRSFESIKMTTGVVLIIGALVAFYAAFTRRRNHVQFAYHEIHALAMLVYGISILAFCNTLEKFISNTSFLFIFYTFSEIAFCNWLYNLKQKAIFNRIGHRYWNRHSHEPHGVRYGKFWFNIHAGGYKYFAICSGNEGK